MAEKQLSQIAQWDHEFVWHPFTQMQDWLAQEPVVIERGEGVYLIDDKGKKSIMMVYHPCGSIFMAIIILCLIKR